MAVHRPPTKLDKLASRQPNFRPDAPSPPPASVPAFSPTARRLPLHRAEVTDVFYTPAVPRPNSPAIIVKSNTPDSSRLSRRGTPPQPSPTARFSPLYEECVRKRIWLWPLASPLARRLAAVENRIGFTFVWDHRSASGCSPPRLTTTQLPLAPLPLLVSG